MNVILRTSLVKCGLAQVLVGTLQILLIALICLLLLFSLFRTELSLLGVMKCECGSSRFSRACHIQNGLWIVTRVKNPASICTHLGWIVLSWQHLDGIFASLLGRLLSWLQASDNPELGCRRYFLELVRALVVVHGISVLLCRDSLLAPPFGKCFDLGGGSFVTRSLFGVLLAGQSSLASGRRQGCCTLGFTGSRFFHLSR